MLNDLGECVGVGVGVVLTCVGEECNDTGVVLLCVVRVEKKGDPATGSSQAKEEKSLSDKEDGKGSGAREANKDFMAASALPFLILCLHTA